MIVGDRDGVRRGRYIFWLDGKVMGIVTHFKYLGVVFGDNGKVTSWRQELVRKARSALWRVWLIARKRGWLGVRFWLMLWRTYIASVLCYASEVFGEQV